MTKNSIIRVDDNNLILLEIDTENHTGQGGIMDAEGNFYPFSTVVSPTHSSIVRFEDINVVLIKLDPDTHDSSAIIIDEVSGQVYPIGEPDPSENFQLMYQGNYTTGSSSATAVTLITTPIDIEPGHTITISFDEGYAIYPIFSSGNGSSESYDIKGSNQMYLYCKDSTEHEYTRTAYVIESASNTVLQANYGIGWNTNALILTNIKTTSIHIIGIPFLFHKTDTSNITPEEAIQHITIEVS